MPDPVKPKPRWLRPTLITAQVLLGLGLGLAVAEFAFARRDDGAFPHVNFYVADPELGVRLEPGAHMRFRLHENPVSEIHVNRQGYRGADWPDQPAEGEILVVGDSQVFGLGVGDDETFSAQLAQRSGRPVLNAGVPTYGPLEYLAVTEELLAQRRPQTVIYVINFLNDPFELARPNAERHAVWDGWAVRSETAPQRVRKFPGRQWLFSRSHLVYAARRWWHERNDADAESVELAVPSEGSWEDLLAEGVDAMAQTERLELASAKALVDSRERLEHVEHELDASKTAIDELLAQEFEEHDEFLARVARAQPGDIVNDEYSEAARPITLTADYIRRATEARGAFVEEARRNRASELHNRELRNLFEADDSLLSERERLRLQIAEGVKETRPPSVFDDHLLELADLCKRYEAELIVVALPIDVQVSADEWAKYGVVDAPDMEPSLALLGDLLASAELLGARGLDATKPLRAAEPGAFLDGDIHMTAKGHAALAVALAELLAEDPPARVEPRPERYVVQVGDNLTKIAKRFGTTVDELQRLNKLDSDLIREGQQLELPQ
jgi:hypothetical protein